MTRPDANSRPDTNYRIGTIVRARLFKTAEGTYYEVTIEMPHKVGEIDEVTGEPFPQVRISIPSKGYYMDNKLLSEAELAGLRGQRVQIRYLKGNEHEIWILNEERG